MEPQSQPAQPNPPNTEPIEIPIETVIEELEQNKDSLPFFLDPLLVRYAHCKRILEAVQKQSGTTGENNRRLWRDRTKELEAHFRLLHKTLIAKQE